MDDHELEELAPNVPLGWRALRAIAMALTAAATYRIRSLVSVALVAPLAIGIGFLVGAPPYVSARIGQPIGLTLLLLLPVATTAGVALVLARAPGAARHE